MRHTVHKGRVHPRIGQDDLLTALGRRIALKGRLGVLEQHALHVRQLIYELVGHLVGLVMGFGLVHIGIIVEKGPSHLLRDNATDATDPLGHERPRAHPCRRVIVEVARKHQGTDLAQKIIDNGTTGKDRTMAIEEGVLLLVALHDGSDATVECLWLHT